MLHPARAAACALLLAALLFAAPLRAEPPAPTGHAAAEASSGPASITIAGAGLAPLTLDAAALAAMPRIKVKAEDHGQQAEFEGVPLAALLEKAGAPLSATPAGEKLRHQKILLVVVVGAADGYRALFALPELDPSFTDKVVILADRRDGQPLDAKQGPFRVVAPGEKRQARWVRQVASLTLQAVE